MPFDPNLIQEIEQAVLQKQALIVSLTNPNLDPSQKNQNNLKIIEINTFLSRFYAILSSNQNNLSDKTLQNTAILTKTPPCTASEYLYLGWDYLVRDRLPKLLSTRLFLVIGGGYVAEKLGTDNTLKIISIVILVVFYILSELVLKLATKTDQGLSLY